MSNDPPHLQGLNPQQHTAVTTTEGPLLILAGAGSGKTRVLTRRIAHLLHTGVDPHHILAVTFTNKAAAEMKERVAALVGEAGARVWVSTFHASCCRILRQDIEALGYTRRFSIYDDDDQVRLVRRILDDLGFDRKAHPPRSLLSRIDYHKNRGRDPDTVVGELRDHDHAVLLRVWREYEAALRANDAVDFNDLIGLVVRLFQERPEIRTRWQERFAYVLVDEYQDTNATQYRLLRLLAAPQDNLAVVGDDDQSIYGFRGADIRNILSFEEDFPDAKIIRLERNYRSTPNILDVANALVSRNRGRMAKRLWTEGDAGPPVRFVVRANPRDEALFLAESIRRMHARGIRWEDIAVIYRTNATSRVFEQELARARIPHRIVGGRKFYERREVRDVLAYLRLLVNPADDAAFLRTVNVPSRGIGAKSISALREEAQGRGEPLLATARGMRSGPKKGREAIQAYAALLDDLADAARTLEPHEVVLRVIKDTGYLAMLDDEGDREARSRKENLEQLLSDACEFAPADPLAGPFERLSGWLDSIALTGADEEIPDGGQVTLMTVHNSKGLEYPIVFVVHMMEGQFPHQRSLDTDEGVEEERRLAYVAFTRAERQLVVTWNRQGTLFGRETTAAEPSRFLFGLPEHAIEGDLPSTEPEAAREATARARRRADQQRRLRAFLDQRSSRLPEGDTLRLVDIEDLEDLAHGTRVHHERFGLGIVRRLDGDRTPPQISIRFDRRGTRALSLPDPRLRRVQE